MLTEDDFDLWLSKNLNADEMAGFLKLTDEEIMDRYRVWSQTDKPSILFLIGLKVQAGMANDL